MTIVEKIFILYPELKDKRLMNFGIIVANDGNGDYIAEWNHPTLARPTAEQLA